MRTKALPVGIILLLIMSIGSALYDEETTLNEQLFLKNIEQSLLVLGNETVENNGNQTADTNDNDTDDELDSEPIEDTTEESDESLDEEVLQFLQAHSIQIDTVKQFNEDGKTFFLVDKTGNGQYDYCLIIPLRLIPVSVKPNGEYLIDTSGDGRWEYLFNPVHGILSVYQEPQKEPLQLKTIILFFIVIIGIICGIIFLLYWYGFIGIEEIEEIMYEENNDEFSPPSF